MTQPLSKEFLEQYGIIDLKTWIVEYKAFETYVETHYPQIADEAWADWINREDDENE